MVIPRIFSPLLLLKIELLTIKTSFPVSLPRHTKRHLESANFILKLSQNQNPIFSLSLPDYNQRHKKCCHRHNRLL